MNRSRPIVGAAVLISSAVLIGAGVVAHRSIDQLSATSEAVLRAKEIELDYERLLSTVRDAETGQRGYLLTHDERYLRPYREALRELQQRVDSVTAHVTADGDSTESLVPLRHFVDRKLDELTRTIELKRSGQHDEALALVRSDEGQELMDDVRSYVGEQVVEQQARVSRLRTTEEAALAAAIRTGILVSALTVALTLLLAWVVRRESRRVSESETRLAITLRSIGDAVIATDRQGVITMMNPVAEVITGWRSGQALGRPFEHVFRIIHEDTRAVVESPVTKVLRNGGIVGLANHTMLVRADGQEIAIEDSGAPILDDAGHIIGVVLVFRDATKERAAQKALLDADRRKDEFLATLAHELRNPLAPMRQAALTAAHETATPAQVRWSLAVVQRQVTHMARLLDDLLDVSRITRGKLEVRRERVALKSIVDNAAEIAQPVMVAGQHRLEIRLPAEPVELEVDAHRIAQVFGNLLANAGKYTPPQGRIRLQAERVDGACVVRVIDNGLGLATDDLPRIFEMFTQVTPTPDRPNSGLGIGLALSRALVELHDGCLEAKSAGPGKGSEFIVRLPLAS
jgi:PAS domain S-box-containing protein